MTFEYEVLIIEGRASVDDIRIHSDIEVFYNEDQAFLEDKFGNICEAYLDNNDYITGLVSYGKYYPRYILYRLVTIFNIKVAFLYEDDYYRTANKNDWESRSKKDTNSLLISFKNYNWDDDYRENGLDTRYPSLTLKNHEPTDPRMFLDGLGDDYYIDNNNNKIKMN
jgi:hypothetical protein